MTAPSLSACPLHCNCHWGLMSSNEAFVKKSGLVGCWIGMACMCAYVCVCGREGWVVDRIWRGKAVIHFLENGAEILYTLYPLLCGVFIRLLTPTLGAGILTCGMSLPLWCCSLSQWQKKNVERVRDWDGETVKERGSERRGRDGEMKRGCMRVNVIKRVSWWESNRREWGRDLRDLRFLCETRGWWGTCSWRCSPQTELALATEWRRWGWVGRRISGGIGNSFSISISMTYTKILHWPSPEQCSLGYWPMDIVQYCDS